MNSVGAAGGQLAEHGADVGVADVAGDAAVDGEGGRGGEDSLRLGHAVALEERKVLCPGDGLGYDVGEEGAEGGSVAVAEGAARKW